MDYLVVKALHVIGFVCWFAGLFYMVRLFVYDVEASARDEPVRSALTEQLRLMQRRLWYGITWPSLIATVGAGAWLMVEYIKNYDGFATWLQAKLVLVAGLLIYHLWCGRIRKQLIAGTFTWGSTSLRVWNEGATLFLVGIVFVAILKNTMGIVWGLAGLLVLAIVLMLGIRIYKRIRAA